METDRIQELIDAATELLGESDAMDPKQASILDSLAYLEGIQSWTRTSIRALRDDQRTHGGS